MQIFCNWKFLNNFVKIILCASVEMILRFISLNCFEEELHMFDGEYLFCIVSVVMLVVNRLVFKLLFK